MSKIFVDFEFTRIHQFTTPVSIGIISEDGNHEFYAEFTDFDKNQVDAWLEQNVFNLLTLTDKPTQFFESEGALTQIKGPVPFVVNTEGGLNDWLTALHYPRITFASFGLAYDFILFRELFKTTKIELPSNLNGFGFDVATLLQMQGFNPNREGVKEQFVNMGSDAKHNALYDAHVARNIYLKIMSEQRTS